MVKKSKKDVRFVIASKSEHESKIEPPQPILKTDSGIDNSQSELTMMSEPQSSHQVQDQLTQSLEITITSCTMDEEEPKASQNSQTECTKMESDVLSFPLTKTANIPQPEHVDVQTDAPETKMDIVFEPNDADQKTSALQLTALEPDVQVQLTNTEPQVDNLKDVSLQQIIDDVPPQEQSVFLTHPNELVSELKDLGQATVVDAVSELKELEQVDAMQTNRKPLTNEHEPVSTTVVDSLQTDVLLATHANEQVSEVQILQQTTVDALQTDVIVSNANQNENELQDVHQKHVDEPQTVQQTVNDIPADVVEMQVTSRSETKEAPKCTVEEISTEWEMIATSNQEDDENKTELVVAGVNQTEDLESKENTLDLGNDTMDQMEAKIARRICAKINNRNIGAIEYEESLCAMLMESRSSAHDDSKKHVTFAEKTQELGPARFNVGAQGNRVVIRVNSDCITLEDAKMGAQQYKQILENAADHSLFVFYNLEKMSYLNVASMLMELRTMFEPMHGLLEQKLASWAAFIPTNTLITTTLSAILSWYPSQVPSQIFSTMDSCKSYLRSQEEHLCKKNN